MRRSSVWFMIALLWLVITIVAALHQGWQRAWLQALITILFLIAGFVLRRKEGIR